MPVCSQPLWIWFHTDIYFPVVDTRLADRTASRPVFQEGDSSIPTGKTSSDGQDVQRTGPSPSIAAPKKQPSSETGSSLTELLNVTRADLSEAQRSRSELHDRLNGVSMEVQKLRKKTTQDARRIGALDSERVNLQLRLKDREEELRGKAKLLEVGRCSINAWLRSPRAISLGDYY